MKSLGHRHGSPLWVPSAKPSPFGCHQPNLYLSREARVYDCGVGPGMCFLLTDSGSMAPTMSPFSHLSSGSLRQSRRLFHCFPRRLCCVARKCIMSGRTNWSRIKQRNLMRRRGVEDIRGATSVAVPPPKQPRRKLSKAELREQAAAAFRAWRAGQTSKNK